MYHTEYFSDNEILGHLALCCAEVKKQPETYTM